MKHVSSFLEQALLQIRLRMHNYWLGLYKECNGDYHEMAIRSGFPVRTVQLTYEELVVEKDEWHKTGRIQLSSAHKPA